MSSTYVVTGLARTTGGTEDDVAGREVGIGLKEGGPLCDSSCSSLESTNGLVDFLTGRGKEELVALFGLYREIQHFQSRKEKIKNNNN